MTLLLMAAGRGSRYGKLKQFDGLGPNQEFLMEFSIYDAIKNGFSHIVVITQRDNVDYLKGHLESRIPSHIKIDVIAQELSDLPEGTSFSGERAKPWGTAHAVWTARHAISNSFAVINADDYYGAGAFEYAARFMSEQHKTETYGLVAYTLQDTLSEYGTVSRGVCKREGNRLVSVEERIKIGRENNNIIDSDSGIEFTGNELVSMNFWICQPSIFKQIEEDFRIFLKDPSNIEAGEVYLPFVIQEMLQQQKTDVEVISADSLWFGVTYANDKEIAMASLAEMTAQGSYPAPLWSASATE